MASALKPTVEYAIRALRQRTKGENCTSIKRTVLPLRRQFMISIKAQKQVDPAKSLVRARPLNGDRHLLNLKASSYLRMRQSRIGSQVQRITPADQSIVQEKVGAIRSNNPILRGAQAIGSAITPGNLSSIRSPIRSGLYRALTPGGGGGGRKRPGERGYRCPAGFEFGGRFTDSEWSTCGAQLFDLPSPMGAVRAAVRNAVNPPGARVESLAEVVEGGGGGGGAARTLQIQRMAQIPRNAAPNEPAFNRSVTDSLAVLKQAPPGEGRMIRRDGIALRPLVPSSVLRQFSGNPDMLDGAMIRAISRPADISQDDLALLAGPSMSRISFVTDNGVEITIQRARPLTVGERRKFGRQLNRAVGTSDEYDVGGNIRQFAENSGGAFKYTEKYGQIPKPLEFVEFTGDDGIKRRVRRWVYETFVNRERREERRDRQQAANEAENRAERVRTTRENQRARRQ